MDAIRISREGPITTVTLDRPKVRNAFNETLIAELTGAFSSIGEHCRVVILTGNGNVFCAGADINWMKKSISDTQEQNARDADAMARMFRAIDECPKPVVGRINGHALGGGMGLVACCDVALAVDTALFGFTEVRLGIVPAVISPFALRAIGTRAARRYFLTGERFDAATAHGLGLVHAVAAAGALDTATEAITHALLKCGPNAVTVAKQLIREVPAMDAVTAHRHTVETTARARTSPEGQEGLGAFLEKRNPRWLSADTQ